MYDSSQLKKGVLEPLVLKMIMNRETYGYEIITNFHQNGFSELGEGTLYPILKRLEKKNMITSVMRKSSLGPRRKYYNITADGKKALDEFLVEWENLRKIIENITAEEV